MASGKYEAKAPAKNKIIKNYQPKFEAKSQAKEQQFRGKKVDKQRALIWLAAAYSAAWLGSVAITPAPPETAAQAAEKIPSAEAAIVQEYLPDTPETPEATDPKTIFTIGVGNYGSEITIDNPETPGEDSYSIYGSIVIISEDKTVTTYDENGNLLNGPANNITEITQITEEEMSYFHYYQVISESGANVISNNNVITTIPTGDFVIAYKSDTSENYLRALYTIDDTLCIGEVEQSALEFRGDYEAINYRAEQNVAIIEKGTAAMVNTKSADYINLKLREQPGQAIITEIPHGSFVELLGETKQYGNKTWSLVKYVTPDGKEEFQGWVNSQNYLSFEVVQAEPSSKVREGINVNSTGNVSVIDISGMSGKDLNQLHQNGISAQTVSIHGTYNTSELQGENGAVIAKLGASGFAPGALNILEYENYLEQIALCEEQGIPYMFYYYSTSITEEEALKEVEVIEERMNDLKQRCGLKYCMGIAVDKELAENTQPDRQRNGNIEEQTKALATLINEIQGRGLSEYVLIYGPMRVMRPNLDQIFSLKDLKPMLDNPENVAVWLTSLMNQNGNVTQDFEDAIAYTESCGFSVAMTQVVLDAKVANGEKYDINNMDFGWYKKLTSQIIDKSKTNDKTSYTVKLSNQSNEDNETNYSLGSNPQYDDEPCI